MSSQSVLATVSPINVVSPHAEAFTSGTFPPMTLSSSPPPLSPWLGEPPQSSSLRPMHAQSSFAQSLHPHHPLALPQQQPVSSPSLNVSSSHLQAQQQQRVHQLQQAQAPFQPPSSHQQHPSTLPHSQPQKGSSDLQRHLQRLLIDDARLQRPTTVSSTSQPASPEDSKEKRGGGRRWSLAGRFFERRTKSVPELSKKNIYTATATESGADQSNIPPMDSNFPPPSHQDYGGTGSSSSGGRRTSLVDIPKAFLSSFRRASVTSASTADSSSTSTRQSTRHSSLSFDFTSEDDFGSNRGEADLERTTSNQEGQRQYRTNGAHVVTILTSDGLRQARLAHPKASPEVVSTRAAREPPKGILKKAQMAVAVGPPGQPSSQHQSPRQLHPSSGVGSGVSSLTSSPKGGVSSSLPPSTLTSSGSIQATSAPAGVRLDSAIVHPMAPMGSPFDIAKLTALDHRARLVTTSPVPKQYHQQQESQPPTSVVQLHHTLSPLVHSISADPSLHDPRRPQQRQQQQHHQSTGPNSMVMGYSWHPHPDAARTSPESMAPEPSPISPVAPMKFEEGRRGSVGGAIPPEFATPGLEANIYHPPDWDNMEGNGRERDWRTSGSEYPQQGSDHYSGIRPPYYSQQQQRRQHHPHDVVSPRAQYAAHFHGGYFDPMSAPSAVAVSTSTATSMTSDPYQMPAYTVEALPRGRRGSIHPDYGYFDPAQGQYRVQSGFMTQSPDEIPPAHQQLAIHSSQMHSPDREANVGESQLGEVGGYPEHEFMMSNPRVAMGMPTKSKRRSIQFLDTVELIPAHRKADYNRRSDKHATFKILTTEMKVEIRDELNAYKMREMAVHVDSMSNTAFH